MGEWKTLNETLRQRREEEPAEATFQERAEMRMAALLEGFWMETKPEAFNNDEEEKS